MCRVGHYYVCVYFEQVSYVFCCCLQFASESVGEGVKSGGVERCRGPDCQKPVKPGSVYCTEACIHAHAQESIQLLRQDRSKNVAARPELKVCRLYQR